MDKPLKGFSERYSDALEDYVFLGREEFLKIARELGREAFASGFGLVNFAKLHSQALSRLASIQGSGPVEAAETFFLEALGPFDVTDQMLQEEARNMELAFINSSLQEQVSERRRTEKALREREEHYRILYTAARQMEDGLENLARKLLHVQEEERKRISMELHDEVGSALTGVNLHLVALSQAHGVPLGKFKDRVASTQHLVAQTMKTVHRFARELRPAMLDDLGLEPALNSYIREFAERSGVRASFSPCKGLESLDWEEKTVLYRVVQESLNNVAKHAEATRVEVRLRQYKNAISLEVRDNGKAFCVEEKMAPNGKRRLGLSGMQDRVRLIHGTCVIESTPGKGTIVRVQIPLKSI